MRQRVLARNAEHTHMQSISQMQSTHPTSHHCRRRRELSARQVADMGLWADNVRAMQAALRQEGAATLARVREELRQALATIARVWGL